MEKEIENWNECALTTTNCTDSLTILPILSEDNLNIVKNKRNFFVAIQWHGSESVGGCVFKQKNGIA